MEPQSTNQQEPIAMSRLFIKILPYVLYSVAAAGFFPLFIQIPMLPLLAAPLLPSIELYKAFFPPNFLMGLESGIEADAFGMTLKSSQAWIFYSSYALMVGFLVTVLKLISLSVKGLEGVKAFRLLVFVFLIVIPVLYIFVLSYR